MQRRNESRNREVHLCQCVTVGAVVTAQLNAQRYKGRVKISWNHWHHEKVKAKGESGVTEGTLDT